MERLRSNESLVMLATAALLACFLVLGILLRNPFRAAVVTAAIPVFALFCMRPKYLAVFQVIFCCVLGFLVRDLHMPSALSYLTDVLNVFAAFFAILNRPDDGRLNDLRLPLFFFALFLAESIMSGFAHDVELHLMLWALRMFCRYALFAYSCIVLLDPEDWQLLGNVLFAVLAINVVLCSYQAFVLGNHPDLCTGLFNLNGGQNVHLVIVTTIALFRYLGGRMSALSCIACLAACLYIVAIAEIKYFYYEVALIAVSALIFTRFSWKKLLIVVTIAILLPISLSVLTQLYPNAGDYLRLKNLIPSLSVSYTHTDILSRGRAMEELRALFMPRMNEALFGLGLGSGQGTALFSSELYQAVGEIYYWSWFSHASVFLETGYIGIVLYALVLAAFGLVYFARALPASEAQWCYRCGAVFAALCIISLYYDASLITEPPCYLIGAFLAMPMSWAAGKRKAPTDA